MAKKNTIPACSEALVDCESVIGRIPLIKELADLIYEKTGVEKTVQERGELLAKLSQGAPPEKRWELVAAFGGQDREKSRRS